MSRDPFSPNADESMAVRATDILRRRRILALAVFTTVLASALSFAHYLPDLFQASAVVLVERQISEAFVRPTVTGELESRLHVIKQETLSRSRLTELVKRFNLYPELRKANGIDNALDQMRHDIVIETTGPEQVSARTKTVAFRLSYTGESKDTVPEVTNAIAAFYVAQNDHIRSQEAVQTSEFLKAQVAEAKKQLDHEEQSLRTYTTSHSGELPQQAGVNLATLERLNTQLRINADQQIRTMEQREKLLDGIPDLGSIAGAGDAAPADWLDRAKRLAQMRDDLQQLETRVTAKHPDVLRLKEQIAALEHDVSDRGNLEEKKANAAVEKSVEISRLTQARRRTLEGIDKEMERLKKEESDLRQTMGGFERRLESAPERQQEYALISRGYQAAKDLYDTMLKKYDEAQLAESMETDRQGERFRILEAAATPEGPAAPNRTRLMLMGLLAAIAAAGLAVLGAEQLDTSFHTVDELRGFTSIPVLATIPRVPQNRGKRALRFAIATVSILAALALVASVSAHVAQGNDQLVRLLVRG